MAAPFSPKLREEAVSVYDVCCLLLIHSLRRPLGQPVFTGSVLGRLPRDWFLLEG